jgi:GTP-binding protein EngB required for normal cell division
MTALLESAKKMIRKGAAADVGSRVEGLERAVAAARGRLDDAVVDEAAEVAERSGKRLRLSADHTVVALAGATGSGKSSTFNALSGLDLAAVGVRRPTTSWTTACVWGAQGAGDLLDWLGVPKRHQVARDSMLDTPRDDRDLQGLVLLDLPDHDSTEVSHHLEVDRLVKLTDLLVWVLDPQKYADAAIHDRYLKPLARHKDVMLIVLNHVDEVPEDRRQSMVDDLRRLLEADGLDGVPLLVTSAKHGDGIPDLKKAIARQVAEKKATTTRLLGDVSDAAARLQQANGAAKPADVARARKQELVDAFADAAGVPTVVNAVERATRLRAQQATGWPVTAWLSRARPDPLKRLHLDLGARGRELTARPRVSMPQPTHVQQARVHTTVRALADDASEGLAKPWVSAIRHASVSRLPDLNDALDGAVSDTDLGISSTPLWWRVVQVLQWALVVGAAAGALWLGVLAVMAYLRLDTSATPEVAGVAVPTLLLLGGVAVGLVLALVSRLLAGLSARSRAKATDKAMRSAIADVTQQHVVDPIEEELAAYRAVRDGVEAALK